MSERLWVCKMKIFLGNPFSPEELEKYPRAVCKNAYTQICELTRVSADVKFIIIKFCFF